MSNLNIKCTLCDNETEFYRTFRNRDYLHCNKCNSILMDPKDYISLDQEKARYEKHNNDIYDPKYQNFVLPLVNKIIEKYKSNCIGLDFGSGTGPVISKLLSDNGYTTMLYDPFFWNDNELLKQKYDYIILGEVVEHFHNPKEEFKLLKSLLNENGSLFIMTELYSDETNFMSWHYKNDETHVFYYSKKTFEWIKTNYSFKNLEIDKRVIILSI